MRCWHPAFTASPFWVPFNAARKERPATAFPVFLRARVSVQCGAPVPRAGLECTVERGGGHLPACGCWKEVSYRGMSVVAGLRLHAICERCEVSLAIAPVVYRWPPGFCLPKDFGNAWLPICDPFPLDLPCFLHRTLPDTCLFTHMHTRTPHCLPTLLI